MRIFGLQAILLSIPGGTLASKQNPYTEVIFASRSCIICSELDSDQKSLLMPLVPTSNQQYLILVYYKIFSSTTMEIWAESSVN